MIQKNEYLASALEKLHSKNEDFIIFGLTGRTGSGCTTAAKLLASKQKDINHCFYTGDAPSNNAQRKEKILNKFYSSNWQEFIHLRVSCILTLMLLHKTNQTELEEFLDRQESIRQNDKNHLLAYREELIKRKEELSAEAFYIGYLTGLTTNIRKQLEEASFIKLYQLLGRNARRSGNVTKSDIQNGEFFSIARQVKHVILAIHDDNKKNNKSTYVVVDAIRSPLEATYFQERFASFYLMAISCDEETRKERLEAKGLPEESIASIDNNEYTNLNLNDERSFTDQDIQGCLEKADIYIDSNAWNIENNEPIELLANKLIKFACLAQKPGLITPSPEERCMQVAYTSKLNSGCLSRQVGAVVTRDNFSIKAVGWNDTPYGQVPCNLRSIDDLHNKNDKKAYSQFELNDPDFRKEIGKKVEPFKPISKKGYNHPFCFKSEYNALMGDNNQVHTRSLHAEENAFLQISKDGGIGVEGGFLFTTASPCELCAKKAYQLGMTKIFYIDPYPGISFSHILASGREEKQPQMVLFNGAIGRAFHNLYTPIAPYKDELRALYS